MRLALLALAVGISLGIGASRLAAPLAPARAQPSADFTRYAGFWSHHDGFIRISANGTGYESHRTYVNCKNPEASGCDYLGKKYIYNGGFVAFRLTGNKNGQAIGYVTASSASWLMHSDVRIGFAPNKDAITMWYGETYVRGCGDKSPAGYCGA